MHIGGQVCTDRCGRIFFFIGAADYPQWLTVCSGTQLCTEAVRYGLYAANYAYWWSCMHRDGQVCTGEVTNAQGHSSMPMIIPLNSESIKYDRDD